MRRQILGPLVDGPGRVTDRDAGHAQQHTGIAAEGEGVRQRVAGVAGDGADAVLGDHRSQQFGATPERGVPADLLPLPVDLDHRRADPVGGVFVNGAQRRALRAQVPSAPDVVLVTADALDAAVGDLNLQAAHGLTQRAGVEVAAVLADAGQLDGGGHRPTVNPPSARHRSFVNFDIRAAPRTRITQV